MCSFREVNLIGVPSVYHSMEPFLLSFQGKDLLAEMGQKTRDGAKIINKSDRLDFVPSTIIDGVSNNESSVCSKGFLRTTTRGALFPFNQRKIMIIEGIPGGNSLHSPGRGKVKSAAEVSIVREMRSSVLNDPSVCQ